MKMGLMEKMTRACEADPYVKGLVEMYLGR